MLPCAPWTILDPLFFREHILSGPMGYYGCIIYIYTYIYIYIYEEHVFMEWCRNFGPSMSLSLRPLTTGLSAGSSVALAWKLLEWADSSHFQPLLSGSTSRYLEPWSFLFGLITGLLLYGAIEWALTLRWCVIQWVEHQTQSRPRPRPKELYKLL